ncbi:MAG: single-stranded DNA-binding protein [Oscillospiraceae bacterium]|nr:single-stranded DNA-binding protein [Oscillospiraceae bacterium]
MINKVILMGRLTDDPKFSQSQSGVAYCRFSVAVTRKFADKNTGERQADFINVVAWRQTAEFVSKYFSKGKMIIVEGSLRNNNYTDSNNVKHYTYDVVADEVSFGESKSASSGNSYDNSYSAPANNGYARMNQPAQNANNSFTGNNNANSMSAGNLDDFTEVLSDGDVPF